MKRGFIGLGLNTGMPALDIVKWSKRGERNGFDSIWLSEDPYYRDSLPLMSVIAENTRRVRIATCIVNIYTKHPVYMAMAAATVDEISEGRLVLGVGRGVKSLIEGELHISYGSPLQYTKEYLVSLRKLLAGKKVTLEGEGVNMTNAQLHFVPLRSEIPILLAAMGPKMLNLAAEYGDGAMLNSCTSVKQAKHSAEIVSSSSRGSIKRELVCALWVSVDEDVDKSYDGVRMSVAFLLSIPTFGEVFLKEGGFQPYMLEDLRRTFRWDRKVGDPMWHLGQADASKVKELVDDRIVDALTVCGPVEDCRRRIRDYHDVGVTTAIVNPMTSKTFAKSEELVG